VWEEFYLLYGWFPYLCAKLFTDHTTFTVTAQRKMLPNVDAHQLSPYRRHGTLVGIRNANISTCGANYL